MGDSVKPWEKNWGSPAPSAEPANAMGPQPKPWERQWGQPEKPEMGPPAYGYYGTKDEDLNPIQRAEKAVSTSGGAGLMGLVPEGREMFSPDSLEAKKAALPGIATAVGGGALALSPVGPAALMAGRAVAPVLGKGLMNAAGMGMAYKYGGPVLKKLGLLGD